MENVRSIGDSRSRGAGEIPRAFRGIPFIALIVGAVVVAAPLSLLIGIDGRESGEGESVRLAPLNVELYFPKGLNIDLGVLKRQEKYSVRVPVTNKGTVPFRYDDLDWGCKPCARVNIQLEKNPIMPGETSHIVLSSDVPELQHGLDVREFPIVFPVDYGIAFMLSVTCRTEDEPRIKIAPARLLVGQVWRGDEPKVIETIVRMYAPPEGKGEIKSVITSDSAIQTSVITVHEDRDHKMDWEVDTHKMRIVVDPKALALGEFEATITVDSNCGSASVKVSGEVTEAVFVQPSVVLVPVVEERIVRYVTLRNLSDREMMLVDARSNTPGVECSWATAPKDNGVRRICLTLNNPSLLTKDAWVELLYTLDGVSQRVRSRLLPF